MHEDEQADDSVWYMVAAGLILVLAAAIRLRSLGTTLFEDEVWVAKLLKNGGLTPHTYNIPALSYAIGRLWVHVRGVSDSALRETAAFFGVALAAVPYFAPRPPRVRLIWSALLAFSSPLLFYSTRLKQYTLEAFVVTVLIVLLLRAYEGDRTVLWIVFFSVAAASVLTLHSPIFLVFAAAIAVLPSRRRPLLFLAFALMGALFAVAWIGYFAPGPTTPQLHGDMTEWFTRTGRWITSPRSFFDNSKHWTGHAMNLVPLWWVVVIPLVIGWLVAKRDLVVVTLATVPPLIVLAASIGRIYPYGEVRLMIFCFPALYLVVAESLTMASRRIPILLIALTPFIINGAGRDIYNRTYMHVDDLRVIYTTVINGYRAGEPVFADPSFAAPLHYYAPSHDRDLHSVTLAMPQGPGWYVQRASRFDAHGAGDVIRQGDVIAVHVP